jgi:hypothetical protein
MATPIGNCGLPINRNPIFIMGSVEQQNAADGVYVNKNNELLSSVNGTLGPGIRHDVKLLFRTDYERMQYLMGLYGRTSRGLSNGQR